MARIAYICPYFGKLPGHINFWFKTISYNNDHHFFLITNDQVEFDLPDNLTIIHMEFSDFKAKCQEKFNFRISLDTVRKIGDYKPALGYIFEEMIDGYDAWGHVDVADEWYGNISTFITDDILMQYEKVMLLGHMTVYRNSYETNRRFMMDSGAGFSYKEVYSSQHFFNFEELAEGSINQIFINNKLPIKQLSENIADITDKAHAFRRAYYYDLETGTFHGFDETIPVYSWEHGRVYGYELKDGKINKKEMLYIHIKRRKIEVKVDSFVDKFLIVPDTFIPFEDVTVPMLEKYAVDIVDKTKKRKRIINSIKYHVSNKAFHFYRRVFGIKVDYLDGTTQR